MKVTIQARGKSFDVMVPDALTLRAVQYAMGVIAQRETASMGEKERKDDGTPYTEANRIKAIADRFARIGRGEWAESGGRSADPEARELTALLRRAEVYKKAKPAYKPDAVPGASSGKVAAFLADHFTPEQTTKLTATAKRIARAKEADVL